MFRDVYFASIVSVLWVACASKPGCPRGTRVEGSACIVENVLPCENDGECVGVANAKGQCVPNGACAFTCNVNFADCDGDLNLNRQGTGCEGYLRDETNCGACGQSCNDTQLCGYQTGACGELKFGPMVLDASIDYTDSSWSYAAALAVAIDDEGFTYWVPRARPLHRINAQGEAAPLGAFTNANTETKVNEASITQDGFIDILSPDSGDATKGIWRTVRMSDGTVSPDVPNLSIAYKDIGLFRLSDTSIARIIRDLGGIIITNTDGTTTPPFALESFSGSFQNVWPLDGAVLAVGSAHSSTVKFSDDISLVKAEGDRRAHFLLKLTRDALKPEEVHWLESEYMQHGFRDDKRVLIDHTLVVGGAVAPRAVIEGVDATTGKLLWSHLSRGGDAKITWLIPLKSGRVFFAGYFSGKFTLGQANELESVGNNDVFAGFVDATSGTVSGLHRFGSVTATDFPLGVGISPNEDRALLYLMAEGDYSTFGLATIDQKRAYFVPYQLPH